MLADAQKCMATKKFGQARALYVKCTAAARIPTKKFDNNLAYYFSLAYYAAVLDKKMLLALRYWRQSLSYLEHDTEYRKNTMLWLFNSLVGVKRGAKNKNLLTQVAACQKQFFKAIGPLDRLWYATKVQVKPSYYFKHDIKVADPFALYEKPPEPEPNKNANAKEKGQEQLLHPWIKAQVERSQIALALAKDAYTLPEDFYAAGWAQTKKLPFFYGNYFFQAETTIGTHHSVLRRSTSDKRKGKVILNTAKILKNDELFAGFRINKKGTRLLYGVSKKGSDLTNWRVRDIERGVDIGFSYDNIVWGAIHFHSDGRGVVYQIDQGVGGKRGLKAPFYYRLPGNMASVRVIHTAIDPKASSSYPSTFGSKVLVSENYSHSFNNRVYIKNANPKSRARPLELFAGSPGDYRYVGWHNHEMFFYTHHKAPRGRVIAVKLDKKYNKVLGIREFIAESDNNITSVYLLKSCILIMALVEHGRRQVFLKYDYSGNKIGEIACPVNGIIGSVSLSYAGERIYFYASAKDCPATIYCHSLASGKTTVYAPSSFKPDLKIKTKTVMVKSKDGTLVPLHLSHRADLRPGKRTPCLMSVYGGFGVNMTTGFNYQSWSWIESGGIWAQPYLRGGQELGKDWHHNATVFNKHKTFEDAEACAQYLLSEGLTSSKKLALQGGSNGGLTVAALLNRNPELYGAAIINNGLLDMLKFQTHSNGWSWLKEYGSVTKRAEFLNLKSYSPYHNIKANKDYPAVLLCISMDDDRVLPWHSFKYAGMLAYKLGSKARFLIRLEHGTGHANSKPSSLVEDELSFLHQALKL